MLGRIDLPDDAWKADTYLLSRIVDEIEERRPQHVVELGSGVTSLVITQALSRNGGCCLHSYDQHAPAGSMGCDPGRPYGNRGYLWHEFRQYAYFAVLSVIASICAILFFRFKKSGWL